MMRPLTLWPVAAVWAGLLGLLGSQLLLVALHWGAATPFVGAGMAVVVATGLMGAARGPAPVRLFVCFGAFWLAILLGLGLMDPLTRTDQAVAPVSLDK